MPTYYSQADLDAVTAAIERKLEVIRERLAETAISQDNQLQIIDDIRYLYRRSIPLTVESVLAEYESKLVDDIKIIDTVNKHLKSTDKKTVKHFRKILSEIHPISFLIDLLTFFCFKI